MRIYKNKSTALLKLENEKPLEDADTYLKASGDLAQRSRDSFERCDTDGCVSQFCDDLGSRRERMKYAIAMNGGKAVFRVLVDIDTGKLISTKLFTFVDQYSYGNTHKWLVNGAWITDYKLEKNFAKKGLRVAYMIASAYIANKDPLDRTPEQYGFSGLTSVRYLELMDREKDKVNI